MAKEIRAFAPTRIDFAGGTLDIPPLFLLHYPAVTINAAINLFAKVRITPSPVWRIRSVDQNLGVTWTNAGPWGWRKVPELELLGRLLDSFDLPSAVSLEAESGVPKGSGLGGSSALAIAATLALSRWKGLALADKQIIEWAKSIETQTLKVPTGYQDYWAAFYGGINSFRTLLDGTLRRKRLGSPDFRKGLSERLLLCYAGEPHFSGANNWQVFKDRIDGKRKIVDFFEQLRENAQLMQKAFEEENCALIAESLNKDWEVRKGMVPRMPTPQIDGLIKEAPQAGALGARVCGAGGGGCVLFLVDPERRRQLAQLVRSLGMRVLPFKISEKGAHLR